MPIYLISMGKIGSNFIFRLSLFVALALSFAACGKITNAVDIQFERIGIPSPTPSAEVSHPFLGHSSAAQTLTSGAYKLEGSIGPQMPSIMKSSGDYKLYGGIHGEVVSR